MLFIHIVEDPKKKVTVSPFIPNRVKGVRNRGKYTDQKGFW
jgi:hypothetical protein